MDMNSHFILRFAHRSHAWPAESEGVHYWEWSVRIPAKFFGIIDGREAHFHLAAAALGTGHESPATAAPG